MTKVTVHAGVCGFTAVISAEKAKDRTVSISIDSDCEMVRKMEQDISGIDIRTMFTGYRSNPVYRSASLHVKHVACPVISGILKAVEVEAGLAVPNDVKMIFGDSDSEEPGGIKE